MRYQPAAERYESKVDRSGGPNVCNPWIGGLSTKGYGRFYPTTFPAVPAHQWAWEQAHGEIPLNPATPGKKFPVDHECHNEAAARGECGGGDTCLHRRCQNLAHMSVTTSSGNTMNSALTLPRLRAARTHCPAGHPYDKANTYVRTRTRHGKTVTERRCRRCNADRELAAKRAGLRS